MTEKFNANDWLPLSPKALKELLIKAQNFPIEIFTYYGSSERTGWAFLMSVPRSYFQAPEEAFPLLWLRHIFFIRRMVYSRGIHTKRSEVFF